MDKETLTKGLEDFNNGHLYTGRGGRKGDDEIVKKITAAAKKEGYSKKRMAGAYGQWLLVQPNDNWDKIRINVNILVKAFGKDLGWSVNKGYSDHRMATSIEKAQKMGFKSVKNRSGGNPDGSVFSHGADYRDGMGNEIRISRSYGGTKYDNHHSFTVEPYHEVQKRERRAAERAKETA